MSITELPHSEIVSRLRAAGCVFAEDEAQLLVSAAASPGELAAMVDRRIAGLPLEHVLGWAEFCGLRIAVDPGVFVPRRRTEFLARKAAAVIQRGAVVVDMCCGSGAVALALTIMVAGIEAHAVDIEPAAVNCARRNLPGAHVYEGDLYQPLPETLRGRVDVLVANAPYVPTEEVGMLPPEARLHEPLVALDGGADGLDIFRRITAEAPQWLAPQGHLLVETSRRQASLAVAILKDAGLAAQVASSKRLHATVVIGRR